MGNVTLHKRCEAVMEEMRDRGTSFAQFIYDTEVYEAFLMSSGKPTEFIVMTIEGEIVYKTLAF